jgi:hypothetical protein
LTEETVSRVQREARELDERYLTLDASGEPGSESAFRLARAATALAEAFDPDPREAAANAVYEALHATGGEPELLIAAITELLSTGSPP